MTTNRRLSDFVLGFLRTGGSADVDDMNRVAEVAHPDILQELGEKEFDHAVAAARETLD